MVGGSYSLQNKRFAFGIDFEVEGMVGRAFLSLRS